MAPWAANRGDKAFFPKPARELRNLRMELLGGFHPDVFRKLLAKRLREFVVSVRWRKSDWPMSYKDVQVWEALADLADEWAGRLEDESIGWESSGGPIPIWDSGGGILGFTEWPEELGGLIEEEDLK